MTLDDERIDAMLKDAAPRPGEVCIDAPNDFDAGQLQAWKLGQLSEEAAEPVVAHVSECDACRALAAAIAPLSDAVVRDLADQTPRPSRRWAGYAVGGVLVAAAAVLLLMVRTSTLPNYTADPLTGGIATMKGVNVPVERPIFTSTSTVRWGFRPDTSLSVPPSAAAFVAAGDGRLIKLPPVYLQPQPGGAWVLRGPASKLFAEAFGPLQLVVVMAREAAELELSGQELSEVMLKDGIVTYVTHLTYRRILE